LEVREIELRGKFIVFEGLDFSGKSTQVKLLAGRLKQTGYPVTVTREPGGTPIGERVRKEILSTKNVGLLPLSELLLFITCRAQLTAEMIAPALREQRVVVSSRYRLSSLAYQGYGRGIDLELIRRLNEAATGGLKPDLTFLIDLPEEIALARKRGKADRIEVEDLAFYRRVRKGYLELAQQDPQPHRIDGTSPVQKIADEVASYLGL
jgi:dTMP kinase